MAMPLPRNASLWNSRWLAYTLEFHHCIHCSRPAHGYILGSYGMVVNVTNTRRSILRYTLVLGRTNVLQCVWCLVPRNRLYCFTLSPHRQARQGLLTPRTWPVSHAQFSGGGMCCHVQNSCFRSPPSSRRVSQLPKRYRMLDIYRQLKYNNCLYDPHSGGEVRS